MRWTPKRENQRDPSMEADGITAKRSYSPAVMKPAVVRFLIVVIVHELQCICGHTVAIAINRLCPAGFAPKRPVATNRRSDASEAISDHHLRMNPATPRPGPDKPPGSVSNSAFHHGLRHARIRRVSGALRPEEPRANYCAAEFLTAVFAARQYRCSKPRKNILPAATAGVLWLPSPS